MAATINSPFFDFFPKIDYDINNVGGTNKTSVPNLFFRLGFLKNVIAQTTAYQMYRVDYGDTPEKIAETLYGDSGAGWMIIYANKIFDPQFDWPLNDSEFEAYIISKYGSVEKALSMVHHAEEIVTTENLTEANTHTETYTICNRRLTDNQPDVPFDYWVWRQPLSLGPNNGVNSISADTVKYTDDSDMFNLTADLDSLLFDNSLSTRSISRQYSIDNTVYVETTTGRLVSVYDYENNLNEQKKFIKVIKPLYYAEIMNEFRILTGHNTYQFAPSMR